MTNKADMTDTNKEREAFIAFILKFPHSFTKEDAERYWEHGHVSALAWQARASLSAEAEPVAWMWQHDETGRIGFVECDQVAAGWEKHNPRLKLVSKLFAAPAQAPAPGWVSVDVDLIRDVLDSLDDYRMGLEFGQYDRERISRLRALLPAAPSSGKGD